MKENTKLKGKSQSSKKSPVGAFINKMIPYVLSVSFVLVLFSLLGITGFGKGIRIALYGVFANLASYFLPIILLYHALMWYYDTKMGIRFRRVFCSILAICCFSSLQYLIEVGKTPELLDATIPMYYRYGAGLVIEGSHGGGVVGGIIGGLLLKMGNILAIIVVLVVLMFMLLQMFNITPVTMIKALRGKDKPKENEKLGPKPKGERTGNRPPKRRKINVFDDDDDDEDFDEGQMTFLEATTVTTVDDDEDEVVSAQGYEDLSSQVVSSRTSTTSSQIRPYDSGIDGKRRGQGAAPASSAQTDSLVVTSTRVDGSGAQSAQTTTAAVNPAPKPLTPVVTPVAEAKPAASAPTQPTANPQPVTEPVKPTVNPQPVTEPVKPAVNPQPVTDPVKPAVNPQPVTEPVKPAVNPQPVTEPVKPAVNPQPITEPVKPAVNPQPVTEPVKPAVNPQPVKPVVTPPQPAVITPSQVYDDDLDDDVLEGEIPFEVEVTPVTDTTVEPPKPKRVVKVKKEYVFPPLTFLQTHKNEEDADSIQLELQENARVIVETLNNFNAKTKVVNITRGPTVTRYELLPDAGVRVRSIANLVDDIALNLASEGIRIECPIPGKSAVGIEVPNKTTSMVYLRDLLEDEKFKKAKSKLTCAVGKSISGENIYVDIEKTPHLLIAGATGMGKSVCINSLLVSLLYKADPDEVRLILIDPKRVELSNYNGIPHLLVPVVCEPKKSLGALQWAVGEMENRFETIEAAGVRNIGEYNEKIDAGYEAEKMARIVIVIDELADLKMAVPDIEGHITRLTQKARAAGIHIIIGTQRPSVDVLTGLIKNNIPSRIAFRVPSQVDSRTILDEIGAEKLVSRGDMLVKIVGALRPARVQGSFVTASEIQDVIDFWKENSEANYDEEVMHQIDSNAAKLAKQDKGFNEDEIDEGDEDETGLDPEFYNALKLATEMGKISSSFLQRRLKLGFQRAARIIDQMEECGYVGEANGSKPREVLISKEDYQEIMMRRNDE